MTQPPFQPSILPGADITNLSETAICALPPHSPQRSIVLIGLMGAGKTTVGRRIAQNLELPFIDADQEIEAAAGETIPEIFKHRGEAAFREGECRVIARLLANGPQVLATGGGAFMDAKTRANIAARGVSIWLRAELDVLMRRVSRRNNRPLLNQGDPRATMERLINERYPIYAEADITVESLEGPHETVVEDVIAKLDIWRKAHTADPHAQKPEEPTK
mgnify:CR=1 FL=1